MESLYNQGKELLEIAEIISCQDALVGKEVKECAADVKAYFTAHTELFEEWGVRDCSDEATIVRLAMVHFLEQGNYVCVRDWKDEKEDFVYFVQNLNGFQERGLSLEEDWLDEDDNISVWSEILDEKWEEKGSCLGAIDLESDCYVLFVCTRDTLERLQELAGRIGWNIGAAKEM